MECHHRVAVVTGGMSQAVTESCSAAKGGILALPHALSISLAGRARVNAISPGWIDTSGDPSALTASDRLQHLVDRVGQTQDIVNLVFFLCSEKNGFITGENIRVDGGMLKQMIYHGDHGWTYQPSEHNGHSI
ncbi:SDR family oxidoreductase [Paenibacillus aquistagni]|uniref:SDR family oxidoreductase n=1 Tax=Paenibacillus aquistagni TaxID=1852522 RepID=UPI00216592D2|nr:SDR family oxidoreductase [Paenibacillus aquistagni]